VDRKKEMVVNKSKQEKNIMSYAILNEDEQETQEAQETQETQETQQTQPEASTEETA